MTNLEMLLFGVIVGFYFRPFFDVLVMIFKNAWRSYKYQPPEIPKEELRTNNTEPQFRNTNPVIKYKDETEQIVTTSWDFERYFD